MPLSMRAVKDNLFICLRPMSCDLSMRRDIRRLCLFSLLTNTLRYCNVTAGLRQPNNLLFE